MNHLSLQNYHAIISTGRETRVVFCFYVKRDIPLAFVKDKQTNEIEILTIRFKKRYFVAVLYKSPNSRLEPLVEIEKNHALGLRLNNTKRPTNGDFNNDLAVISKKTESIFSAKDHLDSKCYSEKTIRPNASSATIVKLNLAKVWLMVELNASATTAHFSV